MKMKFWQQNTVRAARKPGGFIRSLAAAIVPVYILATIVTSYAETPTAAIVVNFKGNGLNLRRGTNRNVTPVRTGQRYILENPNDVLYVPGDRSSTVRFAFAVGQVWESGGLRVQTNPSATPSEYSFPCRGSGGFAISWRPQGETQDRACREGVTLGTSGDLNTQLPLSNPFNLVQAAKNILKAQANKEVVVVPSQGRTIIQTNSTGNDVLVDVAEGNVLVKSDKNPAGRTVRAGERYSYARNTVTPIDRNALLNSPSMQEFLNPNNWSSPNIPQRVADGIAKQVADDRTALGQDSPASETYGWCYINIEAGGGSSYYLISAIDADRCREICATEAYCRQPIFSTVTYLVNGQNQVLLSCDGYSETFVGIGIEPLDKAARVANGGNNSTNPAKRSCTLRVSSP